MRERDVRRLGRCEGDVREGGCEGRMLGKCLFLLVGSVEVDWILREKGEE